MLSVVLKVEIFLKGSHSIELQSFEDSSDYVLLAINILGIIAFADTCDLGTVCSGEFVRHFFNAGDIKVFILLSSADLSGIAPFHFYQIDET